MALPDDLTPEERMFHGSINYVPSPDHLVVETFATSYAVDGQTIPFHILHAHDLHDTLITIKPPVGQLRGILIEQLPEPHVPGLTLRLNLYTDETVAVIYRDATGMLRKPYCPINRNGMRGMGRVHLLKPGLRMHRHPHLVQIPDPDGGYAWQFVSCLYSDNPADYEEPPEWWG